MLSKPGFPETGMWGLHGGLGLWKAGRLHVYNMHFHDVHWSVQYALEPQTCIP